jgi:hypothetical protein
LSLNWLSQKRGPLQSIAGRERLSQIDRAARIPLLSYAWSSAEEAIRQKSIDRVVDGLLALIIDGGVVDLRDDIMRLAVLLHSARMLNADAAQIFADIARLSPNPDLAEEIRTFPGRPSETRDLPAFSVRIRNESGTFAYEFEGASYKPPTRRFWP